MPPVAVNVWLYESFAATKGSEAGKIVIIGQVTIKVYSFAPVQPPITAVTVKVLLPKAVGVPLNTPAVVRLRPAGNVPVVTAKEAMPVPPVAVRGWL